MTPYEQAVALYAKRPDMDFTADILNHMAYGGYVLSTPDCIALARWVAKDWPDERLIDPRQVAGREEGDTWFVWLLCGNLAKFVEHLPHMSLWVAFSRQGQQVQFRRMHKVLAKIG